MSQYNHNFSNFGRPPVPDDICKDSAMRHPRFWRKGFLNIFIIYGHGCHHGQWTATILASFHFPAPGRLQMKFEQHWPRGFYHIMGMAAHLGQPTATILAIFRSPNLRRLHMKFEQNWLRGFRGGRLKMFTDGRTQGQTDG